MTNIKNNKYYQILLNPETNRNVKIPSNVPTSSCTFQLHNSIELPETNNLGNLCLIFNPFFLASNQTEFKDNAPGVINPILRNMKYKALFYSSLYVNNSWYVSGDKEFGNYKPINIGQCIEPIYDQYRLVSASIVVRYIGKLDDSKGTIGGGIIYEKNKICAGDCEIKGNHVDTGEEETFTLHVYVKNFKKYSDFNLIRKSYYHQENQLYEGIKMIYFPLDNSYYEYSPLIKDSDVNSKMLPKVDGETYVINENFVQTCDYVKNGFQFAIYVQNGPIDQVCLRCDIYCNFECLPSNELLKILPITISNEFMQPNELEEAIAYIQKKPIFKFNEIYKY